MANRSRAVLGLLMKKIAVIAVQILPLLPLVLVPALLLVGTSRADIFVSNYAPGNVVRCHDDGTSCTTFVSGVGTAEGVRCVKLSSDVMYVADNGATIGLYHLSDGSGDGSFTISGAISIAALAINATGTVLFAADYDAGKIWAIDLPDGSGPCTHAAPCSASTPASHDIAVGPDGNVYGTYFSYGASYGVQMCPWNSTTNAFGACTTFIPYGSGGAPGLVHPGGLGFDGAGNLWVTNAGTYPTNGIFEFTGPLNSLPARFLNFTADPNSFPLGIDISPLNPPQPPVDSCKGCIVFTELAGRNDNGNGSVSQIDPTTCTGTINSPGSCTLQSTPLITFSHGTEPKYVHFEENCRDTGYLEICKLSCLFDPVTGFFNFTASISGDVIGPLSVPVNACSGPIQIPNGAVNVQESQKVGVVLEEVMAYDYDYFGDQTNALISQNLPFTNANVNVVSGDVSTETIANFTNCLSGPGELKICKVAGSNDLLNDMFMFTVKGFGPPMNYWVEAGPPPGGYCVVAGMYAAGTPVLVTEPGGQHGSMTSNIAVAPADRQGKTTSTSVIAKIDSGTTEVTFTDVDATQLPSCPTDGALYSNGPVNAGVAAWPINFGFVTSDTFTVGSRGASVSGLCFYAWVYPGDIPESVEVSITSSEFGGTSYFDGAVNLTCQLVCTAGQHLGPPPRICGESPSHPTGALNVYACTASFGPVGLAAGTDWLNLQNASVPSGDPVFWDENSGPSSASENAVGTIPSESFVIYGMSDH